MQVEKTKSFSGNDIEQNNFLRIGLIGVGSIGAYLLEAIQKGVAGRAKVVVICGLFESEEQLSELAREFGCAYTRDLGKLADYGVEVVVEAAAQEVVKTWAVPLLEQGLDLLIMSVGALADSAFYSEVCSVLKRTRRKLYVPSGAVGGLDVLRAAGLDRLDEVRLVTSKPPLALAGAPFFKQHQINLDKIKERELIFEGPATEAVKLFPQNVNVAAVLSLAGLGPEKTIVTIIADPDLDRNVHEVKVRGSFGELSLRLENLPSSANPKTSFLACLSPLALLRRLSEPVWIGT